MCEFADAVLGIGGGDRAAHGPQRGVIQFGHKSFVEIAHPTEFFVVAGFDGHDLDVGDVFAQESAGAHQSARGAQAGDEVGDLGQVGEQFRAGAAVVGLGVGGVAVLVEQDPFGVFGGQLFGERYRGVGSASAGENMISVP